MPCARLHFACLNFLIHIFRLSYVAFFYQRGK
jgi:hypothetical protein